MQQRLHRSTDHRMIAGVCGGIAEYFNVDPTIVRLLWALASLFYFAGVVAYIIAWVLIPEEPGASY